MRKLCIVTLVVLAGCIPAFTAAAGPSAGVSGFTVSMGHVNELIRSFGQDSQVEIEELRVGIGMNAAVDILSLGDMWSFAVGGKGLFARESSRDVTVSSSLIGLFARATFSLGRLQADLDLGAHRGALSFPDARLLGLSGWGAGLALRVGYGLPITDRLGVTASLGLQWLPVMEMRDGAGQKYRGRGTPFVDFSGIAGSIALNW